MGNQTPRETTVSNTGTAKAGLAGPRLSADTVFIDVDETMTTARRGAAGGLHPLQAVVMRARRVSQDDARHWIESAEADVTERVGRTWPFGLLDKAGATERQLWRELCRHFRRQVRVLPDVAPLLRFLRGRKIRVFPATTNPRLYILGKLATGGLARQAGSPYLTDCFGGEEVSPGGKCGPRFFKALLQRTDADPQTTVMIGDDRTADLSYARQAGIQQVVLVDRTQTCGWAVGPDSELLVRGLRWLPRLWSE